MALVPAGQHIDTDVPIWLMHMGLSAGQQVSPQQVLFLGQQLVPQHLVSGA